MCRHLISVWPSRRLFHSKILATTSPIANPLFCSSNKFNKSIHSDSKKSVRLPSVVSSSSASKLHTSFRSFLSISSSYDDRVNHCALLRKCNSSTTVVRSFSFRSSVRDIVRKAVPCDKAFEEKEPDDGDFEECGREEDMPQCDAVVAVLCTVAEVDVFYPWRRKQEPSYGAGLILSGRRVLTTAHSVDQYTQLEVGKEVWGPRYTATMLAVAPECDLAILTVHDDEFWNQVKPVEFGDMPSPGDKVIIDRLRKDEAYLPLVTACVLGSGMTRYSFWGTKLLAFRINVGRNGASGGGPAFDERGKCVGLKLQSQGYRSGDFVPAEVIKHFIQDYDKNGAYTGLPLLSIKWQKMENPYLRMLMKMEHDEQGVLITEVGPNYPESVILKPNDVILSIDGININNDGTVPFLSGRRIEFSYLIGKKYVGDKIVIKVRRGLEICEFTTELATHKQFVPANIIGRPLRYYIIGGFVFTTLSFPCMEVMDNRYYNDNERYEDENERPDDDKLLFQALYQEPVVLLQVLKADINAGYKTEFTLQNQVLVTFNDKPVEGLNSLVSMVETCNEDFIKFTFGNKKTLVLPTNIARSRTPDILKAHSISCAMSDDLKELVKLTQGEESPIYISEI